MSGLTYACLVAVGAGAVVIAVLYVGWVSRRGCWQLRDMLQHIFRDW